MFHLNSYRSSQELLRVILNARRSTAQSPFSEAVKFMKNVMFTRLNGDRDNADNVAVILTDGRSDITSFDAREEIRSLKESGTRVVLIGIDIPSPTDLNDVADYAAVDNTVTVPKADQLEFRMDDLYTTVCTGKL